MPFIGKLGRRLAKLGRLLWVPPKPNVATIRVVTASLGRVIKRKALKAPTRTVVYRLKKKVVGTLNPISTVSVKANCVVEKRKIISCAVRSNTTIKCVCVVTSNTRPVQTAQVFVSEPVTKIAQTLGTCTSKVQCLDILRLRTVRHSARSAIFSRLTSSVEIKGKVNIISLEVPIPMLAVTKVYESDEELMSCVAALVEAEMI